MRMWGGVGSFFCSLFLLLPAVQADTFTPYVIRQDNGGNSPGIQPHNMYVSGGTEFIVTGGGQKAGLGANVALGTTIGDIQSFSITRFDDTGRFAAGSGPAVAPYFNIWVTDGMGNYAVIANEPSNPAFQPLFETNMDGSKTYDLSFADLASQTAKVYETPGFNTNSSWVHNLFGNDPLTFGDIASLLIAPPDASYITNGNGVGSGAPRELGTNIAYGVNWIFGDSLSNYVSGQDGYIVGNASISPAAAPVPEPASLALWGLMSAAGTAYGYRRRRGAKSASHA